jgi:CDP-4-dehydro-6-deoxyglucose reductase
MKQQFYDAEIIGMEDVNAAVRRFYFRVPHMQQFVFKPGQFVMLNLPIESKVSYRSYSIASAPAADNTFELIIVLNPPGMGTPHMWEHYRVGSIVPVAGPIGKFTLPPSLDRDLCFIATGTGIAPLRSMIRYIIEQHIPHKHIYLVFGNRHESDILYRTEWEQLQTTHPQFTFIPVLSRAHQWSGKHGYVHPVYEELFSDKRPAYFYLCGWSAMLREARERLSQLGYSKEFIKFELYD